jgi:hypothetical protein
MKRFATVALAAALLGTLLLVSGCAGSPKKTSEGKVWGYVASADSARLELSAEQPGGDQIVVDRVLAPDAAWIVMHADDNGKPGMRVGLAHVERGESKGVRVALQDLKTDKVIVAVHADKGTPDKFDFDMMKKETSPDRPYFVDRKELAQVVWVR